MLGTSFGRRILRWGLWILMGWVFMRGIISFLPPPVAETASLPQVEAQVQEEPAGLRSFPALFATEYMTWRSGQEEERANRLRPYIARTVDRNAGLTVGRDGVSQQAVGSLIHDVQQVTPTRWLITVAVQVVRTQDAVVTGPDGEPRQEQQLLPSAVVYVGVPVGRTPSGGWVVYDYPTLMPAPPAEEFGEPLYFGQETTDRDEKVKALLNGFFKVYIGGSPADLEYFVTREAGLKPLQGRWSFDSVGNYTLLAGETDHWALASVRVADGDTGAIYTFRYTLGLTQVDDRWYIKTITQKGE